ncbi:iron complex outermembrane recepter protein [uncultured Thiomicrorhabdus sp.]
MQKKYLIACLLAAPIHTLSAASTELDQVLVSASQQPQTLQEITADTYIIDQQTLSAKHYTTLIDALREVPGISFTRNGGIGSTTNVFLRGSSNNRTLILLDGVRLNDPASTNGANLASISLANIERIEIIKGAQSGVWGADAAAGVINLISKQSSSNEITVESGAYNTQKAVFNSQFLFGDNQKHKLIVGGERLLSEGFSAQVPAGEDIDQYEADGIAQTNLNAKLDFNLGNQQHLLLSHNHTASKGEYDGFLAPDSLQRFASKTILSSAIWRNRDTEIRLEQSKFRNEQLDSGTPDIVTGITQSLNLKHQIKDLVLGANHSRNKTESDKYSWNLGANQKLTDSNHSNSLFAVYSHQLANWQFNEAIRWDNYSSFGTEITGKIGAKYHFAEQHNLSANFGTAFNAPSQIQVLNPWGSANPDLAAETSQEFSLSYQWNGLNFSYFNKRVTDLISWQNSQYQNIEGTSKIRGYELGYGNRFGNIDAQLNYTYLKTKDANGNELPRRPRDQVNLDLTWFASSEWDINFNALYIGERSEGNATDYYTVCNLVANYQANSKTRFYLKVDNLFNEYYQVVDGYGVAERSAYLGVNYQF